MEAEGVTDLSGLGLFVSNYRHSLDPKKRLTIPATWRDRVGSSGSLYILPDLHERCLCAFPSEEMVHRLQRLRRHSITDKRARAFARVLASQSELVTWDAQGRIRIKDELLDFAGLTDAVTLVGAFDSFELWNPDTLESVGGMNRDRLRDIADYVDF